VFSYPNRGKVMDGVSFLIKPGERVAILGRIGTGKTTLMRLLLNLYQAESGSVLLDGVNVERIDPNQLRVQIGYAPQELALFSDSMRVNVGFRDPTLTDEEIQEAIKVAGLEALVESFEMGLDMPIGERGEGLSGGQRQSVTLARAVVGKPKIYLFDEPTSLMDNTTEAQVLQRLNEHTKGSTLLLITHRPQLLAMVDRIIVFDAGKIAMDGPKEAVLKALSGGGQAKPTQGANNVTG
jgi:ATP-binding cassette subfamily C protein LapB